MHYLDLESIFPDLEEEKNENEAIIDTLLKMKCGAFYEPKLDCLFIKIREIEYDALDNYDLSFVGNCYLCGLFTNNGTDFALVYFNFKSLLDYNLDIVKTVEYDEFLFNFTRDISNILLIKDIEYILDFIKNNKVKIPAELVFEALKFDETVH